MSGFAQAFPTNAFEINAIGSTGSSLVPGTAVKLVNFPSGPASPNVYFEVVQCGAGERPVGIVSIRDGKTITDTLAGRVVRRDCPFTLLKIGATLTKGTNLKIDASGNGVEAAPGDTAYYRLEEDVTSGQNAWVSPIAEKSI
jgi:hypothetical protein